MRWTTIRITAASPCTRPGTARRGETRWTYDAATGAYTSKTYAYSLRYAYADDGNVESISNALAVVEYAYTPDRLGAGHTLTLSNGVAFAHGLARDGFHRSLVTGISSTVRVVDLRDDPTAAFI